MDSLKRIGTRKFAVSRTGSDGTNSSVVLGNPSDGLLCDETLSVAWFEVIRVLLLKMQVLWHMMSCRL